MDSKRQNNLFLNICSESTFFRIYCCTGSGNYILKGQCHKMVVEFGPWITSIGLRFADPFFHLKIGRFNATFHRVGPHQCWLSDRSDFAITRLPIWIFPYTYLRMM
jgi:hypothetical protein